MMQFCKKFWEGNQKRRWCMYLTHAPTVDPSQCQRLLLDPLGPPRSTSHSPSCLHSEAKNMGLLRRINALLGFCFS